MPATPWRAPRRTKRSAAARSSSAVSRSASSTTACEQIFKVMKEIPEKVFGKPFEGASISLENNPALLGVGYIIGPRISALMMGGGVLSYLVLIPAIKYFGSAGTLPLAPETGHTHRRHVGRADSARLHSLHRRGRRRRRRHHQSLPLAAAHLAWIERRAGRPAQLAVSSAKTCRAPIRISR